MNRSQKRKAARVQRGKLKKRLLREKGSGDWVEANLVKDKLALNYRQNPTRCERKLWNAMGDVAAHEGWSLEAQVLITPYIADILIVNKKVIVEADGPFHRKAYDKRRDKVLLGKGYRTIRISNELIRADVLAAVEQVKAMV